MSLPKSVLDSLIPQFLLQRKIPLLTKVDGESQETITQSILALNMISEEPITLFIDSDGGNTTSGRYIADAIRCSAAPVNGIVVACAHSMAFWILQNCHRRIAYPHARMMTHGYSTNGARCDQADFQELTQQLITWHAEDLEVIAQRSGQPLEQWRKWSADEHVFLAEEGLRVGILDEIIPAKPFPSLG